MAKADLGITLIEHLFLNNLSLTPSIMDRKEKPEDKEVYKAKQYFTSLSNHLKWTLRKDLQFLDLAKNYNGQLI